MLGTTRAMGVFVVFVLVMYVAVFRTIRRESANDTPV